MKKSKEEIIADVKLFMVNAPDEFYGCYEQLAEQCAIALELHEYNEEREEWLPPDWIFELAGEAFKARNKSKESEGSCYDPDEIRDRDYYKRFGLG